MSNITTKQSNVPGPALSEWGDQYVGAQDIILAKILPMQPTSQFVANMQAQIGEFRDSLSCSKLGSIVEPLEILPFFVRKSWDIHKQDKESGQFKWAESEPLIENPAQAGYNDNLPWHDTINGEEIKRIRRMDFFVMLPSEIKTGESVPYVLSFKSTSFREGKKIFTQMYLRNKKAGLPPPAYTFKLAGSKQKNDKGTFIVPSVELGRKATAEEISECLSWFKTIQQGTVKVDESDLKQTEQAEVFATDDMSGTGEY